MSRSTKALVVGIAMAVTLGGCTPGEGTKAGGSEPPIVLEIGTDEQQGRPASDQIEEFARRVNELSGGSVEIKPIWHAAGDGPDWDQRVGRMVISGELDMGNIPARAWDTEGVTSLRALNAPFLITSDELVVAVVTGDLAEDLMSGLEDIGIVGLALLPEGLRHPFAFGEPLFGPHDYSGGEIRTPTSATTGMMFAAFGAATTDDEPNPTTQLGMESAYVLAPNGSATGNVTFYPKVNSLVINSDVFSNLTDEQRSALEQAARETQAWAIENMPSDSEAAARFCELGQAVVLADDADIAALEAAAGPVYVELQRDPLTASLIDKIREMGSELAVAMSPVAACGELPGDVSVARTSVIDGVYRFEVSEDQLRAAGVREEDIRGLTGVYTWTFANGNVSFVQTGPYPESAASDSADHFTVEGDVLTIVWPDRKTEVFTWTTNANGDLVLTVVSTAWPEEDAAYTAQPWVRIGDVDTAALPDGIYRSEVRLEDVDAAGMSNDDGWTGSWTLELSGGTYALTCAILEIPDDDCGNSGGIDEVLEAGYAEVSGQNVSFVYDAELHSQLTGCELPCFPLPTVVMEWALEDDTLTFTNVPKATTGLALAPWVRIGDVEGVFPEGVYRTGHTVESLMASGLTTSDARDLAGTWTLTFRDGELTIHDTQAGTCEGTYSIDKERVSLSLGADPACGSASNAVLFTAGWEVEDGELRFVDLVTGTDSQAILDAVFAQPTWMKIG